MRPYPAYKDSGVEWLGEVPEGWDISPLKHVADFINGSAFKPDSWSEIGTPIIRIENLNGGTDFNFYDGEVDERYIVNQGDILFGWSGNRGTSFGPFIWGTPGRFYLNQHIFNVQGYSCDRLWFYWCLRAVTEYVEKQAHGIIGMVHVTKGNLGAVNIPLPSISEQTAIAAFLDRETAKIDALVAEQRRLIDLLKEKRQAVISHAVTKGLNPNAPLKSSRIDWLGDVPEGWEVVRLRNVATLNPSKSEVAHRPGETEVSFLPMEAVGENGELDLNRTRALSDVLNGYTYFAEGDVTYAKITPCFENGKGALMRGLLDGFGFGTTELTVLRPDQRRIMPEFLECILSSPNFRRLGEGAMYGAGGQKRVPDDFARDFVVGLPSLDEQREIVAAINRSKLQFDTLTATAETAITLLQERRAALVSAAVTGKIDVRHLAPSETEAA